MDVGVIVVGVLVVGGLIYLQFGELFKREYSRRETREGEEDAAREDD